MSCRKTFPTRLYLLLCLHLVQHRCDDGVMTPRTPKSSLTTPSMSSRHSPSLSCLSFSFGPAPMRRCDDGVMTPRTPKSSLTTPSMSSRHSPSLSCLSFSFYTIPIYSSFFNPSDVSSIFICFTHTNSVKVDRTWIY